MRLLQLLSATFLSLGLASTASAQFSVSGPGSPIPNSGGSGGVGDTWPTVQPTSVAVSTVNVPVQIAGVASIEVQGLTHTYVGDLQMTLRDPDGVEHLIFVRPGLLTGATCCGWNGNFLVGDYTFIETGSATIPITGDISPGTYDQAFDTLAGQSWVSGTSGIVNTVMSGIEGPAGDWTLTIYDWAGGDLGSFTGWTLNAFAGVAGTPYCFGDGSSNVCPCASFGGAGEGCLTTSGTGATLAGVGNASVSSDSLVLEVTGGPANKPGLFFQGTSQVSLLVGDGLLCTQSTLRYAVNPTDASGAASQSGLGVNATAGVSLNYQYWFRDAQNPCGGGFNFSNGLNVVWQ